jgi:acetyltransferase-like isoleucine patch superfamily enzyme
MSAGERSTWAKLKAVWREPYFGKVNRLVILYYKFKGMVLYRLVFKRFGAGSYIYKPLYISNPMFMTIGERVSIFGGIRLEVIQDNNKRIPDLSIGDNTNIEQNVHIVCHSRIRIGDNVSITGNCAVVDVTHPYVDVDNPLKVGARVQDDNSFVEIGDGTWIGYGSVVLPNVRIGRSVVIGANSVVVGDVPDFSVVAGSPAKLIKRFDPITGIWVKISSDTIGETDRRE